MGVAISRLFVWNFPVADHLAHPVEEQIGRLQHGRRNLFVSGSLEKVGESGGLRFERLELNGGFGNHFSALVAHKHIAHGFDEFLFRHGELGRACFTPFDVRGD